MESADDFDDEIDSANDGARQKFVGMKPSKCQTWRGGGQNGTLRYFYCTFQLQLLTFFNVGGCNRPLIPSPGHATDQTASYIGVFGEEFCWPCVISLCLESSDVIETYIFL